MNINSAQIRKACIETLTNLFTLHDVDHTHGIAHALVVVDHGQKAVSCVDELQDEEKEDVILACLLHDADDRKYFPHNSDYQNARKILMEQSIETSRVQRILGMIKVVSFSKNGDSIDPTKTQLWYYPRYCDRVDAIGMKGLVRAYQYAKVAKNPTITPQTAKPQSLQQLQQVCKGRQQIYMKRGGKSESFIDHIYDKLYHLSLPEFITNPYLNFCYQEGKKCIADFVIRHSGNNFELVQQEMEDYICGKKLIPSIQFKIESQ